MPSTDPRRLVRTLSDAADVAGFRRAARELLADGVEPGRVTWQVASADTADLFAEANDDPGASRTTPAQSPSLPTVKVPAFFVDLCERAALHADSGRFDLLYRLLWRLVREPGLRDDALDPDRLAAESLARVVRREMHKMTAFVRFRPVGEAEAEAGAGAAANADDDTVDTSPEMTADQLPSPASAPGSAEPVSDPAGRWHVAWFEPEHHIVAATAPFFARRFAQLRWAILTPERCVRWDGSALAFGPGAKRSEAPPADAGEALWLTYYARIFNPARLKLAMMQKEMPRRYWRNLPEAALIQPLTEAATWRSDQMIAQAASVPAHRRPAASIAMRMDADAARSLAAPVGSLPALRDATQACRECPIGALATQSVPGEGPAGASLMLVGEQPGDQEDLRGRPFVGPAGQLLDRAFTQLGWPRDALYLTNAVKHFKYELRGKRRIHKTASQREAAACLHWLEAEIELVAPKALVALGATAARALLGRAVGVTAERGHWLARADGLPVLIALHPSALLRMDAGVREPAYEAWLADLSAANRYARPDQ